jgi:hypothetical protein
MRSVSANQTVIEANLTKCASCCDTGPVMSMVYSRALGRRHSGGIMGLILLAIAAVAFGAWTTYLLATSIPQKMLARAARHGRYADLASPDAAEVQHAGRGRRRYGRGKLAEQ